MAKIPTKVELIIPTFRALKELGGWREHKDILNQIIKDLNLNAETINVPHKENDNSESELGYRTRWAQTYLKKYGVIENNKNSHVWKIKQEYINVLPEDLDAKTIYDTYNNNDNQNKHMSSVKEEVESPQTPITYVSEIIEALKELGGTAKLSEINDCIEKRGKLEYIKSNSNWRDAVRTAIQTHCSKTKSYVEGNEDLFYPVEGLGKGIWGLVDNNPDSNPNNSDILKSHDEWFPSLDEYSSGITTEKWIELLNDKNVFSDKSLKVMKRFLDFGGQATCEELSEKYGNTPGFYSMTSINTIKKVLTVTNCPIMPRNEENSRYWPVFYRGKKAEINQSGKYIWKLRDELKNALSRVDLSDIALYENNGNNDKPAWLLTWNPSKWDWVEYDSAITIAKSGEEYQTSWNCSNHNATIGDTVYMVKLGDPSTPRGIFATGYIISNPYEDDNYDESKETKLKYIDIKLTKILDYRTDDIITTNDLKDLFPEQNWSPQSSGISIKQNAAKWLADNWTSVEDTRTDEPVIWKISHGTYVFDSELREFFIDNKIVVVNKNTNKVAYQPISQGQAYMEDIKKGDYFYLCHSGEIVLFGQFTENEPKLCEEFVNQWNDYDWYERKYRVIAPSKDREKYTGKKKAWTSNFNSTCVKVTDNKLFEELILTPYFDLTLEDLNTNAVKIPANPLYSDSNFLNDVFISESEYTKLKNLLLRKKNIILQGAPGVGKTYVSKRLAYALMGEKDDTRIEFVQFHQNYSYEDFVMGYRPNGDGFELTTGIFYDFCKRAEEDSERDYFFIIDEINRGNLSKIFGELLMLIETDKRKSSGYSVSLAYNKQPFSVPDNLHIIGMMNTADRSLAMIDYALRRRFSFYEMKPAFDSENFSIFSASVDSVLFDKTIDAVKQLNKAVSSDSSLGKSFEIGHSYFCSASPENITDEYIKSVVEYDIIPTLEEYWFDDTDKLEKWKKVLYQAIGAEYDE